MISSKKKRQRKIDLAGLVAQILPHPVSIFWVAERAYASDSNRCSKPAWIHRV
jgi:hypothetical protein